MVIRNVRTQLASHILRRTKMSTFNVSSNCGYKRDLFVYSLRSVNVNRALFATITLNLKILYIL
jgi:hypothetical protein